MVMTSFHRLPPTSCIRRRRRSPLGPPVGVPSDRGWDARTRRAFLWEPRWDSRSWDGDEFGRASRETEPTARARTQHRARAPRTPEFAAVSPSGFVHSSAGIDRFADDPVTNVSSCPTWRYDWAWPGSSTVLPNPTALCRDGEREDLFFSSSPSSSRSPSRRSASCVVLVVKPLAAALEDPLPHGGVAEPETPCD